MSPSLIFLLVSGVIHNACSQVFGNGIGCNNMAGLSNGFVPTGFIPASGLAPGLGPNLVGNNLNGSPVAGLCPVGYGDVAVAGELPVGGTTTVAGQVPVIGYVTFEGHIPAGGLVSVASDCGCNNGVF